MTYHAHPAAAVFPMMTTVEFEELVESIKKNGLFEPICIHGGKIVDGRNRYKACREAGVEPLFVEWCGDNLIEWIIAKNIHRRHLTQSQKATVSIYIMQYLKEQAKERQIRKPVDHSVMEKIPEQISNKTASQQAAELMGVNEKYIRDAMKIEKESPALLQKIRDGKMTIPEAKDRIKESKGQPVQEHVNWKAEYWKLREQVDVIVTSLDPDELQQAIVRTEALLKAKSLPR